MKKRVLAYLVMLSILSSGVYMNVSYAFLSNAAPQGYLKARQANAGLTGVERFAGLRFHIDGSDSDSRLSSLGTGEDFESVGLRVPNSGSLIDIDVTTFGEATEVMTINADDPKEVVLTQYQANTITQISAWRDFAEDDLVRVSMASDAWYVFETDGEWHRAGRGVVYGALGRALKKGDPGVLTMETMPVEERDDASVRSNGDGTTTSCYGDGTALKRVTYNATGVRGIPVTVFTAAGAVEVLDSRLVNGTEYIGFSSGGTTASLFDSSLATAAPAASMAAVATIRTIAIGNSSSNQFTTGSSATHQLSWSVGFEDTGGAEHNVGQDYAVSVSGGSSFGFNSGIDLSTTFGASDWKFDSSPELAVEAVFKF